MKIKTLITKKNECVKEEIKKGIEKVSGTECK